MCTDRRVKEVGDGWVELDRELPFPGGQAKHCACVVVCLALVAACCGQLACDAMALEGSCVPTACKCLLARLAGCVSGMQRQLLRSPL